MSEVATTVRMSTPSWTLRQAGPTGPLTWLAGGMACVAALCGSSAATGRQESPPDPGRSIVFDDSEPQRELEPGVRLREVLFPSSLSRGCTLTAAELELAAGAMISYDRGAAVCNQTVRADLFLRGGATLRNDNDWTHMADMLRLQGRLSGDAEVVVDGTGDGGVQLAADSSASFTGSFRIVGGNLVVQSPGALGAPTRPVQLQGGQLSLFHGGLEHTIHFSGDARVLTGTNAVLRGDLIVDAGCTATLDTGGGNPGRLEGRLLGPGDVVFRGGTRPGLRFSALTLAGPAPNDLTGRLSVLRGTIALGKPGGVGALAGPLVVGGEGFAAVKWGADQQTGADTPVLLQGSERSLLWTNGHRVELGPLTVSGRAGIRMGPGADRIRFAGRLGEPVESDAWSPDAELIVEHWEGRPEGGGEDRLFIASVEGSHVTETPEVGSREVDGCLRCIGFRDPAGFEPGLYTARRVPSGELIPDRRVEPAEGNAFATNRAADLLREAVYASDGRSRLAGSDSPLRDGDVLSFFGDSITWQHGYLRKIEEALRQGEGTRDRKIRVLNRGINGGGVRELRDGSERSAQAGGRPGTDGDAPQAAFLELLDQDRPRAVVIFIGINDVNWRGTREEQFAEALATLLAGAQERGVKVVVATLLLSGELPDGSNPKDAAIDRCAARTRAVALEHGIVPVDLRAAAIAWLRNHNRRMRLDGTLEHDATGLLTDDGIHPSDRGNVLIADLLADGIVEALSERRRPRPSPKPAR